jgi:predicted nucleic acid-binding protein
LRVLDAGVVVELLVGGLDPAVLGDHELAVPHLLDTEVTHVLRGLALRGALTDAEADTAMAGFRALTLTRFDAARLRGRMWELRHDLSAYDATYVALAELLEVELLTTDARLAAAPGPRCPVVLAAGGGGG